MKKLTYKSGYKYQIVGDHGIQTDIIPLHDIKTQYIELGLDGYLIIKDGYASDGPSGPTIDTKNFMRGAFFHDAIYSLIRDGYLTSSTKEKADRLLQRLCIKDGMCKIRAWYVYQSVKNFADWAASPKNKKKILTAP